MKNEINFDTICDQYWNIQKIGLRVFKKTRAFEIRVVELDVRDLVSADLGDNAKNIEYKRSVAIYNGRDITDSVADLCGYNQIRSSDPLVNRCSGILLFVPDIDGMILTNHFFENMILDAVRNAIGGKRPKSSTELLRP